MIGHISPVERHFENDASIRRRCAGVDRKFHKKGREFLQTVELPDCGQMDRLAGGLPRHRSVEISGHFGVFRGKFRKCLEPEPEHVTGTGH